MLNSNIFFPINDLLSVGRKYITTRSLEKLHTLLNFSIKNMKIIHHMYSQHTKHRDSEARYAQRTMIPQSKPGLIYSLNERAVTYF